jgi:DNA repair protein RecN (Recombination protein N)
MLTAVSIRDVVLIERLELELGTGLTVLTGETGAGKSILLDGLGLALGERGGPGLIRAGADSCAVSASFEVGGRHPVRALLSDSEIEVEAGEALVLRRTIARDGRSRAFVNDQAVGAGLLRRVGALLVEVQGQHEQMGLADPATHRGLLDGFAVDAALLAETRGLHAAWRGFAERLAAARSALEAAAREEDWLRLTVDELAALAPVSGEEDGLAATRVALQQGERRAEMISAALAELTPRDRRNTGPAAALRAASRALSRLAPAGEDGSQAAAIEAAAALDRAEEALAEAENLLSRLAGEAASDPRALEAAEERLFALRAAGRKHGVPPSELPSLLDDLRGRLAALDAGTRGIDELAAETGRARAAFAGACGRLGAARREAAGRLERAAMAELAPLRLERARFVVEVSALSESGWNEAGADGVAFLIAANPGQPPGPLGRVASGGELSRLMLALKVVLAAGSPVGTLVFDEVDSGVGGATASAVGERLALVARERQVLVVTHSPQVAARGAHHLRVAKRVANGTTLTDVVPLDRAEREEEIARMLAGERVTDAARGAALSLLGSPGALPLDQAGGKRPQTRST